MGKKSIIYKLMSCLFLAVFLLSACAKGSGKPLGANSHYDYAKQLQAEGRYEIAKEYFLLALAEARTYEEQNWLERELFTVDLQIKTLR